jgi:hypothetical protein
MQTVSIVRDFTPFPGGRYRKNGNGSGEDFRERFLVPPLRNGAHVTIDLDGASGYPPSFLEEAFGGLVRQGFSPVQIRQQIRLSAGPAFEGYTHLIWDYVDRAAARASAS